MILPGDRSMKPAAEPLQRRADWERALVGFFCGPLALATPASVLPADSVRLNPMKQSSVALVAAGILGETVIRLWYAGCLCFARVTELRNQISAAARTGALPFPLTDVRGCDNRKGARAACAACASGRRSNCKNAAKPMKDELPRV